jgi:hypothetical protein
LPVIVLDGVMPSKKSCYKTMRSGRLYLPKDVKQRLKDIQAEAELKWKFTGLGSLVHPDVAVIFYVSQVRQDSDGQWTTLLDILQRAKVIKNDNHASFNGTKVIKPAVFVDAGKERTVIQFIPKETQKTLVA